MHSLLTSFYNRVGWPLYALLVLFRLYQPFSLQPGYLHPDEFFQSVEVGAGDIYGLDVERTWEFQVNASKGFPIRSSVGLNLFVHLPVWIYKQIADVRGSHVSASLNYTIGLSGRDLLTRVLVPVRFSTALFSLVIDLFLFVACHRLTPSTRSRLESDDKQKLSGKQTSSPNNSLLPSHPPTPLLLYASACFGGLLWSGRSFSNNWEAGLVALYALLTIELVDLTNTSPKTPQRNGQLQSLLFIAFAKAFIFILGLFIRPTFPLFVFAFALYDLCLLLTFSVWRLLSSLLVALATLALYAFAFIAVDTRYYGGGTDFICTPCNFLAYNSNSDNLAQHGTQPIFFHLFISLPLMLTPLGFVCLLLELFRPLHGPHILLQHFIRLALLVPLVALSLVAHKEPRFLLPLLPFAWLLVGRDLDYWIARCRSALVTTTFVCFWILQQLGAFVFYAYLHQSAILSYFESFPGSTVASSCPTIAFYRTYMPYKFPVGRRLDAPDDCFQVYDLNDLTFQELIRFVKGLQYSPPYLTPPTQNRILQLSSPPSQFSVVEASLTSPPSPPRPQSIEERCCDNSDPGRVVEQSSIVIDNQFPLLSVSPTPTDDWDSVDVSNVLSQSNQANKVAPLIRLLGDSTCQGPPPDEIVDISYHERSETSPIAPPPPPPPPPPPTTLPSYWLSTPSWVSTINSTARTHNRGGISTMRRDQTYANSTLSSDSSSSSSIRALVNHRLRRFTNLNNRPLIVPARWPQLSGTRRGSRARRLLTALRQSDTTRRRTRSPSIASSLALDDPPPKRLRFRLDNDSEVETASQSSSFTQSSTSSSANFEVKRRTSNSIGAGSATVSSRTIGHSTSRRSRSSLPSTSLGSIPEDRQSTNSFSDASRPSRTMNQSSSSQQSATKESLQPSARGDNQQPVVALDRLVKPLPTESVSSWCMVDQVTGELFVDGFPLRQLLDVSHQGGRRDSSLLGRTGRTPISYRRTSTSGSRRTSRPRSSSASTAFAFSNAPRLNLATASGSRSSPPSAEAATITTTRTSSGSRKKVCVYVSQPFTDFVLMRIRRRLPSASSDPPTD